MKRNYFFKLLFTFILSGFFSLSYAADWYISATGNDDTGDGLTAETAWASFSKANTAAVSGDVIHVSGMIDFTLDPANTTTNAGTTTGNLAGIILNKSITLQGTSAATDGFTGTNGSITTRFFQITNAAYTLTLKNLKLANGVAQSTSNASGGGAIMMSTGNIVAENVIFDGNSATGYNAITGAAIHIGGSNATGTSFKNCVFTNNSADKAGAVFINAWAANSTILFENCAFVGNMAKLAFGGSALSIRSNTSANAVCNIINCTFKGNHVNTVATGGTINVIKSTNTTNVNIINCTISENTTAGTAGHSAGVYFLTSDASADANVYIKNSIVENNTAANGDPADLNIPTISATAPGSSTGYIHIEKSIIGRIALPANIVSGTNYSAEDAALINHLPTTWDVNDLKAGLAPFNTSNNTYSLYVGSAAIDYGNSALLSTYSTTDQLGNTRPFTNDKCYAGAWESTPLTTTPKAPTTLVATTGNTQVSVAFTAGADGGATITNYKYSIDGGETFTAFDPAQTTSPVVITGLTNGTEYTVILKAVNENGDGVASEPSNAVTPSPLTGLESDLNNSIAIYKNSNKQLVIKNGTLKIGNVTVYNAVGQRVASANLSGTITTIDKPLQEGVYVILLNVDGKTGSTKIIL